VPLPERSRFRPRLEALEDRTVPSTLTVLNNLDSGAGSLRATIAAATPGDTIVFDPSLDGQTITLALQLVINKDLTINGRGMNNLTVSGNDVTRVFEINAGVHVEITDLTVTHGRVAFDEGGGIDSYGFLTLRGIAVTNCFAPTAGGVENRFGGTMEVSDSVIMDNSANQSGGYCNDGGVATLARTYVGYNTAPDTAGIFNASGGQMTLTDDFIENNTASIYIGGIWNEATLTVTGCTISDNFGGANFGGGVANVSTASFLNCTIAGNSTGASATGGGVFNEGTLNLNFCTIAGNTAGTGGGIYTSFSVVNVKNTLVALNTALTATGGPDASGSFNSQGHNLVGKTNGSSGWVASDITGTAANPIDPHLGPLQYNGGLTPTLALLVGSPALDAANPSDNPVVDQRGTERDARPDIGAFEARAAVGFSVVVLDDSVTAGVPANVLVVAVDAWGNVASTYVGTVHFTSTDDGASLPDDYTFLAGDGGMQTFSVTFQTPGSQSLAATDVYNDTLTGSVDVNVLGG
jgi:hypothetical protein